jgi:hypothetical protein
MLYTVKIEIWTKKEQVVDLLLFTNNSGFNEINGARKKTSAQFDNQVSLLMGTWLRRAQHLAVFQLTGKLIPVDRGK